MREAVLELSREILRASEVDLERKGMGATAVAAWRCGNAVHVAHQGDSRAYLFRSGKLRRLTADHSIVALLVRNGEITEKEAERHPARGQLTRFVGMPVDVYCDVQTLTIKDGDRLLLCTDGLWGVVEDDEMAEALAGRCQALAKDASPGGCDEATNQAFWNRLSRKLFEAAACGKADGRDGNNENWLDTDWRDAQDARVDAAGEAAIASRERAVNTRPLLRQADVYRRRTGEWLKRSDADLKALAQEWMAAAGSGADDTDKNFFEE